MENGIRAIHRKEEFSESFQKLYRCSYELYLSGNGLMAYKGMQKVVREYLEGRVDRDLAPNVFLKFTYDDSAYSATLPKVMVFLDALLELWTEHTRSSVLIADIMMYINENLVVGDMPRLTELGQWLFVDHVVNTSKIDFKEALVKGCLTLINADREGNFVSRLTLSATIRMLAELKYRKPICFVADDGRCSSDFTKVQNESCYATLLKPQILTDARAYFSSWQQVRLRELDLAAYAGQLQVLFEKERERCDQCLPFAQFNAIEAILLEECITRVADQLFAEKEDELLSMVSSLNKTEALKSLYDFVCKLPSDVVEKFMRALGNCWLKLGMVAVQIESKDKATKAREWVRQLLGLKELAEELIDRSLNKSLTAKKLFYQKYMTVLNSNDFAAEYLSIYIDYLLHTADRASSAQEVTDSLESSLGLFQYVEQKDLFQSHHQILLAKRLLQSRSLDQDFEASIISTLEQNCGNQYCLKMKGMYKDREFSLELSDQFQSTLNGVNLLIGDADVKKLVVYTLNDFTWSSTVSSEQRKILLALDAIKEDSLKSLLRPFCKFYDQKFVGRTLKWAFTLGSAELKVHFTSGPCTLILGTPLMLILVLGKFDSGNAIPFATLVELFSPILGEQLLKRGLISLSYHKSRVLLRETARRREDSDFLVNLTNDSFKLNLDCNPKSSKIRIPLIRNTSLETSETALSVTQLENIEKGRKSLLDGTIIRIMKSRKVLLYNQLIALVLEQLKLKFRPSVAFIKNRVEDLINQEYLQRDPNDHGLLSYLA